MEKRKLLIADAAEEFRMALHDYLQDSYLIKVCKEGNETLQAIDSFEPDALILDVMLPGIDGVTLLERAKTAGFRGIVIATTRLPSDYVIATLGQMDVDYVFLKPCEMDAVAVRLGDLIAKRKQTGEVKKPDLSTLVDNALRELGFEAHPRGYIFLRRALLETVRNPNQQVTKTLYPIISKEFGGNAEQMEQAVRRLIKRAWLYRNEAVWEHYFGPGGCAAKYPTNKVFIMAVARRILEDNPAEEYAYRKCL